jgi:hypothetical protein
MQECQCNNHEKQNRHILECHSILVAGYCEEIRLMITV